MQMKQLSVLKTEIKNIGMDSKFWHACAGGMVQMPSIHSQVIYFPQGHAEHATENVDFAGLKNIPPLIPCKVLGIKYMADQETDEVYVKMRLIPSVCSDCYNDGDDGFMGIGGGVDGQEKPPSFAKTLTQSDANNGGGFSVPRYCAETIFPRLDFSVNPPLQMLHIKDVHGKVYKFRHIYRGTPRRHLLTTGWSIFVNEKKLVAGDSIVFLKADNGDICVGIRREKRGLGGGHENIEASPFGGYSVYSREHEKKLINTKSYIDAKTTKGRVSSESVIDAVMLAASGKQFEVVYYPRASTPEFCVKTSAVRAAMQIQWCPGMRFKMAFETEDSSRISWFMGTIASAQFADPINWPNSPWRLLQVAWDEPDLLNNVKRVSPWLAEIVSHMPGIHLSHFSSVNKKLRLSLPDLPLVDHVPMSSYYQNTLRPSSSICCVSDDIYAGIQGARQAHYELSSSSSNLQTIPTFRNPGNNSKRSNPNNTENIACLLTMGIGQWTQDTDRKDEVKAPVFILFGKPILTEEQLSQSCSGASSCGNLSNKVNNSDASGSGIHQASTPENCLDDEVSGYKGCLNSQLNLEI